MKGEYLVIFEIFNGNGYEMDWNGKNIFQEKEDADNFAVEYMLRKPNVTQAHFYLLKDVFVKASSIRSIHNG